MADQLKAGAEIIITRNGERCLAVIDAQQLNYYHQLERERIHLLLVGDAIGGLSDVSAGRVKSARTVLAGLKRRRAAKTAR
jgi:hypothetical protein